MPETNGHIASVFCTSCGTEMKGAWQFCPACGTARADVHAMPHSEVQPYFGEPVHSQIDRRIEALLAEGKVQDAMAEMNEAVEAAPRDYALRMLRAQLYGRIGMPQQAMEDARVARAVVPPGDVGQLLRVQELDRILRERAKGNFTHVSSLPSRPKWLKLIGKQGTDVPARAQ